MRRSPFRSATFRRVAFPKAVTPVAMAATVVALTASTAAGVPAGSSARRAPGARAVPVAQAMPAAAAGANGLSRTVTLITGARLVTGLAGGARNVGLLPGPGGRLASAMLSLGLGSTSFEIPQIALPYLGRGLAPGLFQLSSLLRAETGGRLPVTVGYQGRVPSLPGVRITHASGGTARGYLTLAGARAFGAALARQFAADHARGSYGQDGLFAGGVSIGLPGGGLARGGVLALRRPAAFPMRTLTVTAANLAGKPDTGDSVLVFNADNAGRFDDFLESMNVFRKGVTKFSVPAGHYWAIGDFVSFTRTSGAERFDVLPQFTVSGNTTVHLSERAADSEIQVVTPRPTVLESSTIDFRRRTAAGNTFSVSFSDNFPAFVNPTTRRPTVGKLQVFTLVQRQSPAKAAGTPYQYNVGYGDTSGLIPPQHHVVRQASLATVTARYYSDVTGKGGLWRTGLFLAQRHDGFIVAINRLRVPSVQTEYMSGNPAILWFDGYSQAYRNMAAGQSDDVRTFHAGERMTENWNAYPLHEGVNADLTGAANPSPWVPSASRVGDKLTLDVTPFSDNTPGHGGNGGFYGGQLGPVDHIKGHYAIEENGTTIAAGNPLKGFKEIGPFGEFGTRVTLSPHPGTVRFVLDASGAGKIFALSTASRTVWTWRSRHESGARLPAGWTCVPSFQGILHPDRGCAVQPMMTLNYAVAGLNLRGFAAPGRQAVHVTAGHLQLVQGIAVTSASMSVSFNGGKTWHPATVTRHDGGYTAVFKAPAGTKVSLRTGASDAAGGSITEALINAYQTSS